MEVYGLMGRKWGWKFYPDEDFEWAFTAGQKKGRVLLMERNYTPQSLPGSQKLEQYHLSGAEPAFELGCHVKVNII